MTSPSPFPNGSPVVPPIGGIHHVTAIAGDAQRNLDFYTRLLGLRLVKLTVNFDDPGSYHFYYGDESGSPGSILTFFAWPGAFPGRIGSGQIGATALSVPRASLTFWSERLRTHELATYATPEQSFTRLGDEGLSFLDPDGMRIELIACDDSRIGWKGGEVPSEHAIGGIHSATIYARSASQTAEVLQEVMGYTPIDEEDGRHRFGMADNAPGALVDVLDSPEQGRGSMGAGTVHHIAWRVADDPAQSQWLNALLSVGLNVSPVMDRTYFHSIYFREPGGVLFEIATDVPGFAVDEPLEALGQSLKLPPQYESLRAQIENHLPKLNLLS